MGAMQERMRKEEGARSVSVELQGIPFITKHNEG